MTWNIDLRNEVPIMELIHSKNKLTDTLRKSATVVFLLAFAAATLFPIYFMIISSFAPPIESGAVSYDLIPRSFTFGSYKFFFSFNEYSYRWLLNSLLVSSIIMFSILSASASYKFVRFISSELDKLNIFHIPHDIIAIL
jgi:multiple sugar transport system permease protein